MDLLAQRLEAAGFAVASIGSAAGGVIALAGLVRLSDGTQVFAKTIDPVVDDLFDVEASGLRSLRHLGRAATPEVLHVGPDLLVLAALHEPPSTADF